MIIFVSEGAASYVSNFAHYQGGEDGHHDHDDIHDNEE